jgi:hypothetical protein
MKLEPEPTRKRVRAEQARLWIGSLAGLISALMPLTLEIIKHLWH